MAKSPSQRKRVAQKAISAETDREMMEVIFGKRIVRAVHREIDPEADRPSKSTKSDSMPK